MEVGIPRVEPGRIRAAWQGRISGCLLGKPLEVLSFREGPGGVRRYLQDAGALPLRDYVPLLDGVPTLAAARSCCRGQIVRAEPDDDVDYTLLALLLLEERGSGFRSEDVARAWLRLLPAGATWTAERAAYRTLLDRMAEQLVNGEAPGFGLSGAPIDARWTKPWQGRIGTRLAGHSELQLDDVVRRTVEIARTLE